jgi:myo-inositol-1-phosphate synthase
MAKIKIALVGVGNCASGLVQGIQYYRDADDQEKAVGLRRLELAGYHPRDIDVTAAFDVDARKVGKDLSEAIFSGPNNTQKFCEVPKLDVTVSRGCLLDGVSVNLRDVVKVDPSPEVDVAEVLRQSDSEMLINLLPSGSEEASKWYAKQSLEAGCAFINVTPTTIASDPAWSRRFTEASLPLVGDDLIDQVGATSLHKTLMKLLNDQGVRISETYQLDVGGGPESLNTLERTRETKRLIKTKTVESTLPYKASVVAGTTDYVDFLENRRDSYLWIEGQYFGKIPMQIELRLNTIDGPNAGSVLLDVIRGVKKAFQMGKGGAINDICAYAFKQPPKILPFTEAADLFEAFILHA